MFRLFKKKPRASTPDVTSSKPSDVTSDMASPAEVQNPSMPIKELTARVDASWVGNFGASLFFAQCGGLDGTLGMIYTDYDRYEDIIKNSNSKDFTMADKLKALELYDSESEGDLALLKIDFSAYPSIPDRGIIAEELFQLSLTKREADIVMITSKLDKKWDHISSTFLQLFNSVPNKYGDTNKYGDIVKHYDEGYAPIFAEILEFIGYHFSDEDLNFYFCERPVAEVCAHIVEKLTDNRAKNFKDVPLDGIDFEHWCADALRKFGWQATVSKASGDQGVDILARREGISVAVQCKRYTKPVGNKAVQEAFSGKQHVQASHACVIATGGFTKSAKELASSTGVFLLDAELISDFSKEYGLQNTSDDNNL